MPPANTNGPTLPVRFRTSLYNTVYDVMRGRGWRETEHDSDWDFFWCDVHWLHESYDGLYLREYQRINHFKNHYELTRKDLLVKNIKRMIRECTSLSRMQAMVAPQQSPASAAAAAASASLDLRRRYDIVAKSFVVPQELAMFGEEFKKYPTGTVWIMKPVGRAQGRGIFLINRLSQINNWRVDTRKSGAPGFANYSLLASSNVNSNNNNANEKPLVSGSNTPGRSGAMASVNSGSLASPNAKTSEPGNLTDASGAAATTAAAAAAAATEESEPETYIVQRYIDRPYLIGGKKFDIRSYALVTSWVPLTVYIHRHAFCRFSNTKFSMNPKDISNLYIHATNVAIQKTAPNYDKSKGCKWLVRNLKMYLMSRHGESSVRGLFNAIEELMVRALIAVHKIMINDRNCFELYGYDILIDEDLRPWLLEVNASPSLTAETQWDYNLKYGLINDLLDVIDMERRYPVSSTPRQQVGGFDLVYHERPAPHLNSNIYESNIGAYHPIVHVPRGQFRRPKGQNVTVDAKPVEADQRVSVCSKP